MGSALARSRCVSEPTRHARNCSGRDPRVPAAAAGRANDVQELFGQRVDHDDSAWRDATTDVPHYAAGPTLPTIPVGLPAGERQIVEGARVRHLILGAVAVARVAGIAPRATSRRFCASVAAPQDDTHEHQHDDSSHFAEPQHHVLQRRWEFSSYFGNKYKISLVLCKAHFLLRPDSMGGSKRSQRADLYKKSTYLDLVARLAANTRKLREARGWTQAAAAEHCEIAIYVLQTVEAGRENFTGTVVARLCDGFGVDVRVLFEPAAPLATRPRGRPGRTPVVVEPTVSSDAISLTTEGPASSPAPSPEPTPSEASSTDP